MKELVKIQSELKAPKGQFNKFGGYKYRSAEDILEAVKPLLAANECTLTLTDEVVQVAKGTTSRLLQPLPMPRGNRLPFQPLHGRKNPRKAWMERK